MIRFAGTVTLAGLALHLLRYRRLRARIRATEAARIPVGRDGIVPGAGPILLEGSRTHAVLVIHGFGDTPQSVQQLAMHLHQVHGWTVRALRLPGHGTTLADFDANGSDQWRAAVHREYVALRSQFPVVTLVGVSMGAALATIEASQDSSLPALVLLVPYLTPPASAERLAPVAGLVNLLVPYLQGGDRIRSILDPAARARSLNAGAAPPRRISDLVSVAHDARFAAAAVRAPTLLVHSTTDYRIPVELAEQHAGFFTSAAMREQAWVEGGGHVITVDYCREQVWALTAAWLNRHAGAPSSARPET